MKKILILIVMIVLCCSCEHKTKQQIERERYEYISNTYQNHSDLFELTFKDEHGEMRTHQFVATHYSDYYCGIAHWPDCKYCKERGL